MAGDDEIDQIKSNPLSSVLRSPILPAPAQAARHLVVLVHGIRDFALWQETVGRSLTDAGFIVEFTNYGRFDLIRFLLPIAYFRRKAIDEVHKQIRIAKQTNDADQISVIAHSFGTYVVSNILQENFDLKFSRIIFCGSVVRYGFPFEQFSNRFHRPILNDVGTRDIWPAIAESVTWGYGSAGTYGFRRPLVKDRWHNGAAHGFFLNPDFCRSFWVPFLKSGKIETADIKPQSPPIWIRLLSIFRLKYVVSVLAVLVFGWWISKYPFDLRAWLPVGHNSPDGYYASPLAVTLSLAAAETPYLARKVTNPPPPIATRYKAEADYPTGYYLWPELDFDILFFALRAGEETVPATFIEKSDFVDLSDRARLYKTTQMWSIFEALGRTLRASAASGTSGSEILKLVSSPPADDGQFGIAFLRLVYPDTGRSNETQNAIMRQSVLLADQLMPRGTVLSPAMDEHLNDATRLLATRQVQPVLNLSMANGAQAQLLTAVELEVLEVVGAFSALESGPLTPVDTVQFDIGPKPGAISKTLSAPIKVAANDAVMIRINLRSKYMFSYLCRIKLFSGDKTVGRSADFLIDFGFQPPISK